jgi:hypothetical protein
MAVVVTLVVGDRATQAQPIDRPHAGGEVESRYRHVAIEIREG